MALIKEDLPMMTHQMASLVGASKSKNKPWILRK
jgi:hypothetical protein